MDRRPLRALVLLLAVASAACHDDGSRPPTGASNELRANLGLDLSKVVGFVLSQGAPLRGATASGDAGSASTTQLYAIGADDSLTVVTITQAPNGGSSSSAQTVEPLAVLPSRAYVFFAYANVTYQGLACRLIAARKSDGALYCITDGPDSDPWLGGGWSQGYWKALQSDDGGDLVWLDFPGSLLRFDLADPSHATSTRPLGSTQPFNGAHAVNAAGDDLISNGDQYSNAAGDFTRVVNASGGFFDVSTKGVNCVAASAEPGSNDFYYNKHVGPYTQDNQWVRLGKTGAGAFSETTLFAMTSTSCQFGMVRTASHFVLSGPLIPQQGGGTVDVSNYSFVDVTSAQATLRTVDAFKQITRIAGYEAAAFILGNDATGSAGIVRYDLASGAFSTLLAPGAYNLSAMDVSPGGEVTFYGQRASDGQMVLGNIPAGGTTPNVIATGLPPVTQIQRIN